MKKFFILGILVFGFSYGDCIKITTEHFSYGQRVPDYTTVQTICPASSVKSFYTKTDNQDGFIKLNLSTKGCINIEKSHFKQGQKVPSSTTEEKICK
ncbi:MAG: hypothetical protein ACP5LI_04915 [Hydrogenobaculum sp.]|nr:MAG: hypothetical protein C0194_01005 [Hydrogenobaculum sp.]PMP89715.1 MAG: hypothetical protein C0170_08085 [Hydrogenobaculum sp.]